MTHGRSRRGRADRRRHRGEGRTHTDEPLPEPEGTIEVRQRDSIGFGPVVEGGVRRVQAPLAARPHADGVPGVPLQRDLLHLRARARRTSTASADRDRLYLLPFAAGNFLGPLLLGPALRRGRAQDHDLVDLHHRRHRPDRRRLSVPAELDLPRRSSRSAGRSIFFFASAGASAAYLTVSEVFPMETRAMAIAFFYATATGIGGIIGPRSTATISPPATAPPSFTATCLERSL